MAHADRPSTKDCPPAHPPLSGCWWLPLLPWLRASRNHQTESRCSCDDSDFASPRNSLVTTCASCGRESPEQVTEMWLPELVFSTWSLGAHVRHDVQRAAGTLA